MLIGQWCFLAVVRGDQFVGDAGAACHLTALFKPSILLSRESADPPEITSRRLHRVASASVFRHGKFLCYFMKVSHHN